MTRIETKRNSEARDLFKEYMRGWRDAAARRGYDQENKYSEKGYKPGNDKQQRGYSAYNAGFSDGGEAATAAIERAIEAYGYQPAIVRTSETTALDVYRKD